MNVISNNSEKLIAEYLKVLGSPIRIQILFNIGYGEACVCHLVTALGKRQAHFSQHLMVLRDAGVLDTRRDGKYIFYRVADRSLFDLVRSASDILNILGDSLPDPSESLKLTKCDCPHCQ